MAAAISVAKLLLAVTTNRSTRINTIRFGLASNFDFTHKGERMISEAIPQLELAELFNDEAPTILLIDDDRDQCDVLAHRLTRQGFDVVAAGCGKLGWQAAMEVKPNAIILDVRLPDADGFEICADLADHPETSHIPVIIVSGSDCANAVRRSRSVGSRYYVRKPYDPNALLVLIGNALTDDYA